MSEIILQMQGVAPLIIQSDRSVNPLDPLVQQKKALASKRKNLTDDDRQQLSRWEMELALYMDDELGPVIPTGNVHKCLTEAARKTKEGKKVEEGVTPLETHVPLLYDGPRTVDGLFADKAFVYDVSVVVSRARVMKTRPIFREWAISVPFYVEETLLDIRDFARFAATAGVRIGLAERRPAYGRFEALVKEGGKQNGKSRISTARGAAALA